MDNKPYSIQAVIMCGGSGTRLWPLSREIHPKQLLKLFGDKSLLGSTIERALAVGAKTVVAVTNESHRFLVAEELRHEAAENATVILEPQGKNTAPAVALAALNAIKHGDDPLLLVLAADHLIRRDNVFAGAVKNAADLAQQGRLVTFGIVPTKPETGYGYIQRGAPQSTGFEVAAFVEKPSLEKAKQYIESGDYLWNSGMFMFRASVFINELQKFRPDILAACQKAMDNAASDMTFIRPTASAFEQCPADSIDYAVMEKTQQAAVIPLDAGWSDIGSFASLWEESEKDSAGNAFKGDVLSHQTKNSLVIAEERLVAVIGLDNVMVVETPDAILVAPIAKSQDIKAIVNQLNASNREEAKSHRRVYRPWGWYEGIGTGTRYQVKRICVKPGASLSLQMHYHRAEHWIVVTGTAEVECNGKVSLLSENESTYIPLGHTHRLKNPGKVPLELIEVQSGSYLGEDDIVRFEDTYGRA